MFGCGYGYKSCKSYWGYGSRCYNPSNYAIYLVLFILLVIILCTCL